MPPVHMDTLCTWLAELGYVSNTGFGVAPLSYVEIKAWAEITNKPLEGWIARALRAGSEAYVAGRLEGEKPNSQPPWYEQEAAQAQATDKIGGMLAQLKRR